jgi:hypothetical protein
MEPYLQQIDNLFSPTQCKALIAFAESKGFELIDRGNAKYYRVKSSLPNLAEDLEKKLRDYIPNFVDGKRVTGLNDYFRFSKYTEGQEFGIHRDGVNQNSKGDRSVMTLNIFLNDDFEGGETDFFYSNNKSDLRFSAIPKPGRGALFYAQQHHCGNKIKKGIKYLIRTDLMVSDI